MYIFAPVMAMLAVFIYALFVGCPVLNVYAPGLVIIIIATIYQMLSNT